MFTQFTLDTDGNRLWRPTDSDLHRIVARNFGYLVKTYLKPGPDADLQDPYLEHVTPAFPDWRNEALNNPEKASRSDYEGTAELPGREGCDEHSSKEFTTRIYGLGSLLHS